MKLRTDFDNAVTAYEEQLCEMWEITDGYWAGQDKSGIFCFFDTDCLALGDLIFIVDNGIGYDEFAEWSRYNDRAREFHLGYINLKSWHMNCPRVEDAEFERLESLKKEFEDACSEVREKF